MANREEIHGAEPAETGPPAARRAPRGRLPRPGGLIVLLGLAAVYRALGYLAAGPLLAPSDDSLRYAHGGLVELFSDPFAPSGYPLLLAGLHFLWSSALTVSLAQHVLGLLTVAGLWLAGREVARVSGLPPALAGVPAVFVAFAGDQWFFEQALMTETLFTALVVAAVLALLHAAGGARHGPVWLAAAGAALAAAGVTRPAGFVVAVFCLLWLLVAGPDRPARRRLIGAAVYAAAAAAVLVAYLAAAGTGGGQNGIGSYAGWTLYGRVAPFAQCATFTPTRSERALCESRPPQARPGIYYYLFGAGAPPGQTSPALRVFSAPRGNATLRAFAIKAIEAEPLDYLRAVAKDAFRYIDPTYGNHRPEAGIGPEFVYLATSLAPYPSREEVERLYGYRVGSGPLRFPYESWLTLSRIPGLIWLASILAALGGLALARPGPRGQLALIAGVAFAIALTPVLSVTYEYRYAIPAQGLALLAGVLGGWTAVGRLRGGRASDRRAGV